MTSIELDAIEAEASTASAIHPDVVLALIAEVRAAHAQVAAMKLRALAAHAAIWQAMNAGNAAEAIADEGAIHRAVHDVIAVETPSVSVPAEWRDYVARQDARIDGLEAMVRALQSAQRGEM